MVLFGSFGSAVPYLIYLAIVWLCLLLGVKGNVFALLGATGDTEVISNDRSEAELLRSAHIISIESSDSKSEIDPGVAANALGPETVTISYAIADISPPLPNRSTHFTRSEFLPSISRRGPPSA